jgi:hypothetical protein
MVEIDSRKVARRAWLMAATAALVGAACSGDDGDDAAAAGGGGTTEPELDFATAEARFDAILAGNASPEEIALAEALEAGLTQDELDAVLAFDLSAGSALTDDPAFKKAWQIVIDTYVASGYFVKSEHSCEEAQNKLKQAQQGLAGKLFATARATAMGAAAGVVAAGPIGAAVGAAVAGGTFLFAALAPVISSWADTLGCAAAGCVCGPAPNCPMPCE